MATLETQYKNFKINNPTSTFTFEEWKEDFGKKLEKGIKKLKMNKENNIPTAEEFFRTKNPNSSPLPYWAKEAIIEFAKLHVEEALESASEKVSLSYKQSILNSYPLSNIK